MSEWRALVADKGPVLATSGQLAAERLIVRLLADLEVQAIRKTIKTDLLKDPVAACPGAAETLDRSISQISASLIFTEYAGDPDHPVLIWNIDDTPRQWFGIDFPGAGIAGDNPDQIYRSAYLDGQGRYELVGKLDIPRQPAQLTFSLLRTSAAGLPPLQEPGKVFMGNQFATLNDMDLKTDAEGYFRILIGGEDDGACDHHIPLEPGLFSLLVRDVLSNWTQSAARLELRRLDPVATKPKTEDEICRNVLDHLPAFVRHWGAYHNGFLGGIAANTVAGPFAREGGWGFMAGARFSLSTGEAAIFTIHPGQARYTGFQVNDLWMIMPDARRHQSSLNSSQSAASPDGTITYVVSPEDLGFTNWIDTAGLREGYLLARWQAFPEVDSGEGLLRDFRIVNIEDLDSGTFAALPRVTRAERAAQLARRGPEFETRLGPV